VILLDQLGRRLHIPEVMGQVGHLVVEDIREPLEEDQRQDVILELGSIERPPYRARRAASQSQFSSAETSSFFVRSGLSGSLGWSLEFGLATISPE
jgi:hypothetical protein